MQNLSPKKFIETRVRQLPIYKCLVNYGWQKSHLADVIVMRRHNNGNVTCGVYLVDLLCLGVKDTFYMFNISEDEVFEQMNVSINYFENIDYELAHNIIYAGHDFAMDYDIHPIAGINILDWYMMPVLMKFNDALAEFLEQHDLEMSQ